MNRHLAIRVAPLLECLLSVYPPVGQSHILTLEILVSVVAPNLQPSREAFMTEMATRPSGLTTLVRPHSSLVAFIRAARR